MIAGICVVALAGCPSSDISDRGRENPEKRSSDGMNEDRMDSVHHMADRENHIRDSLQHAGRDTSDR